MDSSGQAIRGLKHNVYAIDIETECAVSGCVGEGGHAKCQHALFPATARITQIAVCSAKVKKVFAGPEGFHRWYTNVQEKLLFVGQNLKFDVLHLNNFLGPFAKIKLDQMVHDTQIMGHVCNTKVTEDYLAWYEEMRVKLSKERGIAYRRARGLSLKTMAPYFLGVQPFWETKDYNNEEYVMKDTQYTYDLCLWFLNHMTKQELTFYTEKALPWSKMLYEAEERGIEVDKEALCIMKKDLEIKLLDLQTRIDEQWEQAHKTYYEIQLTEVQEKYRNMKNQKIAAKNLPNAISRIPDRINFASPAQVKWLLQEYLQLDITTFEGDESTGKGVLERLASEGREDVATFLDYRKTSKILTAFIPTLEELLKYDKAIHASFNATGTRTGRLSCSNPNLQQIPKDLKSLFKAAPGRAFVTYDLAAIEAKLIAWFSEDEALFNIINKGVSFHDVNTQVFFGYDDPIEEIAGKYKAERRASKTVGFALLYSAGSKRIREAFSGAGFIIGEAESKRMYGNFKRAYATAFEYNQQIIQQTERGEILENALGRPIRIQDHENKYMVSFNTLVQSSASDLNLDICHKVVSKARFEGIDVTPILFIHDSFTIDCPEQYSKRVQELILEQYKKYTLTTKFGDIKVTGEGAISNVWE